MKPMLIGMLLLLCPTNTVEVQLDDKEAAIMIQALRAFREQLKVECGGDVSLPEFYRAAKLESKITNAIKKQNGASE